MTTIQVIILLVIIVAAATVAAFLYKNGKNIQDDTPTYTKDELENIKLAEQLYNKDLRPVAAKKAKVRVVRDLNVVEPQFVNVDALVAKATGTDEPSIAVNETKTEPTTDKLKKKRKFYPRKKKQQA